MVSKFLFLLLVIIFKSKHVDKKIIIFVYFPKKQLMYKAIQLIDLLKE